MVDVPAIYGNAPYDWKTAFQPISHIQAVPAVIVVTPSSPIKTLRRLHQGRHRQAGQLTIADSGVGTTNHIVIELMSAATGAKYTLVHYKGSGQASIDVIAGQVPAQVDQLNSSIGHIKARQAARHRRDVRQARAGTARRADRQGARHQGPRGLHLLRPTRACSAPAKMPPEVLKKLNDAMVKVLTDPVVVKKFADLTAEAKPSTPRGTRAPCSTRKTAWSCP